MKYGCRNCGYEPLPDGAQFCPGCGVEFDPIVEDVVERALAEGYHQLPATIQSHTPREPVNKNAWKPCERCGRLIPMVQDLRMHPGSACEYLSTWTYVCPYCGHCHVGTPWNEELLLNQKRCFECDAELAAASQCPTCHFPRGWKIETCPYCGNRQPVFMPHWGICCDWFFLECVKCESYFHSRCIC